MLRTRIAKHSGRARTATLVAVTAAALSAGLAPSASAQSGFVALIPKVAPKFDVAQGAAFELVARNSDGISFAEQWRLEPAPSGHVYITSRLFKNGTTKMAMDIQRQPGPANPGPNAAVGTMPIDQSQSQQWKVQPVPGAGTSKLVNRLSGLVLTFNGTGAVPAYSQKPKESAGVLAEFVIKPLG